MDGKRVLGSGGGSGIGAGIVEAFMSQRANVTFFDIAHEESKALVDRLRGGRGTVAYERVDLKDVQELKAVIGRLTEANGGFDVLVNNAANDYRHVIDDVTEEYWDDRLGVNLKHIFFSA
ncbi:SDR family NAD(P)-dependent oxidoreductase [Sphingomonas sp. CFBP 8760]|uniref:SDR family NAD(P)-dependent oxidoreductase n=1 Tax=Sphingomonas sp. CFBP 8760 TaxID=2775282 RepID=UPI00177E0E60|nr:SDR family NAD(P)-dependent oxidoreductase [Sphingomonas sp. CFBP 8760]MBD8548259.1 SDR family NAD(P)-dependent oxidoreductase [Sphingomonas sp. CFBP 8760]